MALQTQQVVTSSFFKPQTPHFTLGSVVSNSTLRQQQQPMSGNSTQYKRQQRTATQYFKTNTCSNVVQKKTTQKELEHKLTSGDRMETLHSRLQLEAEKIRKWKNATEVEIKHKEKCLEDANHTIEAQRVSLTELQMKNESLASRLRDEVANQREIHRKISSTRDMCTALKDHTVKLDEALCQNEEDKSSLVQLDTDRKQEFQMLLERFQQLEHGQVEWQRVHKEALLAERSKSAQLAEQHEQCQQQLQHAVEKISQLETECCDRETSISQLNGELSVKNEQCDALCKEKANLEHGLCVRDNDVSTLEGKVDDVEKQLADTRNSLSEKEQLLSTAQQTILDNEAHYVDQLASVNSALAAGQAQCRQLENTQTELEARIQEITVQFTDQCQSLSLQVDEAKKQLDLSQQQCSELEGVLCAERKAKSEMESGKALLEEEVVKLGSEITELRETKEREIQVKDTELTNTQAEIADIKARYETTSKEWEASEHMLKEKVCGLERERDKVSESVSQLNCQLKETQLEVEEGKKNIKEHIEKFEETVDQLKGEKAAVVEENTNLKQQIEALTKKEVALSAQCSDLDQLRKEKEDLKETLDSQTAQVNQLTTEVTSLQTELSTKCKELTDQVEVYKKEAAASKLENENAKGTFDSQVNDLCATLERYTAESQKTISQKDKAIENLKQQLQESEVVKRSTESELAACQNKLELVQDEVSTKNEEIKELFEAVNCLKKTVPATPSRNTPVTRLVTPLRKTFSTPVNNVVVSSTPKAPVLATPKLSNRPLPPTNHSLIPSTPSSATTHSRVYNYRVSSAHLNRSRPAPPSTPRIASKAKRMCYQEETDESTKFKELYPNKELEDDEALFKKPKTKGVTVRKASSTTNAKALTPSSTMRRPLAGRNGRDKRVAVKKNTGKRSSEDLSWFELDSVYGFGPDD